MKKFFLDFLNHIVALLDVNPIATTLLLILATLMTICFLYKLFSHKFDLPVVSLCVALISWCVLYFARIEPMGIIYEGSWVIVWIFIISFSAASDVSKKSQCDYC
jgi:hypothetical protein